jgi:hypothetical protein
VPPAFESALNAPFRNTSTHAPVHGSIVVVHLLSIVSIRLVDVKCVPAVVNVDEQRQRAEEEFRLRVVDAPIDDAIHVIVYVLAELRIDNLAPQHCYPLSLPPRSSSILIFIISLLRDIL